MREKLKKEVNELKAVNQRNLKNEENLRKRIRRKFLDLSTLKNQITEAQEQEKRVFQKTFDKTNEETNGVIKGIFYQKSRLWLRRFRKLKQQVNKKLRHTLPCGTPHDCEFLEKLQWIRNQITT